MNVDDIDDATVRRATATRRSRGTAHAVQRATCNVRRATRQQVRNATIAHINNFGQTPQQIWKKPHPPRSKSTSLIKPTAAPASAAATTLVWGDVFAAPEKLEPQVCREALREEVHRLYSHNDRLLLVPAAQLLLPPAMAVRLSWAYADASVRFFALKDRGALATVTAAAEHPLVSLERIHRGMITQCAVSDDGRWLVTGGDDCVLCTIRIGRPKKAALLGELRLRHRLVGHGRPISALAIGRPFSVIVSGAHDHTLIAWDLDRGLLLRQFALPTAPTLLAFNDSSGDVIVAMHEKILVLSINFVPLVRHSTGSAITALVVPRGGVELFDECQLISSHDDGCVRVWGLEPAPRTPNDKQPAGGGGVRALQQLKLRARKPEKAQSLQQGTDAWPPVTALLLSTVRRADSPPTDCRRARALPVGCHSGRQPATVAQPCAYG